MKHLFYLGSSCFYATKFPNVSGDKICFKKYLTTWTFGLYLGSNSAVPLINYIVLSKWLKLLYTNFLIYKMETIVVQLVGSISAGSISTDSTNRGLKIFGKQLLPFADVYCVVRPTMVASLLNMYRLFFSCFYSPTIQDNNYLHSIHILIRYSE